MRRVYKVEDLDCANCAAKMQTAMEKIDGVNRASMSFMTQKFTLDAVDERFDEIFEECLRICKKIEPDMVVLH